MSRSPSYMRSILTIAVLSLMGVACRAQDTTLRTTSTLIVVPTLVQTSARDVVYNLSANDFSLKDNGIPQKIRLETAATQPLSLVVLMQTGGAAPLEFQHYRKLETMLASLLESGAASGHAPNTIAIVNFDSKPEAASPFTTNVAEWTDAINHPDPGDRGAAILDGLAYSLRLLDAQPASNRRAILLISQPTDDGSKTPLKEILRTAAETNTTIYTLTFSPEKTAIKKALKGSTHGNAPIAIGSINPGNATVVTPGYIAYFDLSLPLNLLLSTMQKNLAANVATLTGGEAATFDNRHSLDEDLGTLTTHIRNRYLLTFQPASPTPGLHKLEVRLPHHPELNVSSRTDYWATDSSLTAPAGR
jgi:VWFA-related protein